MRSRYLGWDLTSSPAKPTAAAMLDEALAVVDLGFYLSDDDMIALVEENRPQVIAIDAPLNLPLGLCCLEESCVCRSLAPRKGRQCERQLSKLRISCYYTTKRSIIKKMVYRAMALQEQLRSAGWMVIEIYPYASKVRLFGRLPPKTKRMGRMALQGRLRGLLPSLPPPQERLLRHDSLDALLAAYTGYLYAQGRTEALGDPEEGLLHLPSPIPHYE